MRDVVSKPGHGFVEYQWPQPARARQCPSWPMPRVLPMGLGWWPRAYTWTTSTPSSADAMMFVGKIVGLSLLLAALVVLIKRARSPCRCARGGGHAPGGRAARPPCRAIAQPGRAGHGGPPLITCWAISSRLLSVWGGSEKLAHRATRLSDHAHRLAGASAEQKPRGGLKRRRRWKKSAPASKKSA